MKTSFYFVLWILIYPLLDTIDSSFVNDNSFLIALAIVFGVSAIINRLMSNTSVYERKLQFAPMLEDVYTCNVASFSKRLTKDLMIEAVTSIYFVAVTLSILFFIFNPIFGGWIELIIFCLFAYGAIARCLKLYNAKKALKAEPTSQKCLEIAEETYGLDYTSYYNDHEGVSYEQMLSRNRPKYLKLYQIISMIFATAAVLLGIYCIYISVKAIPYIDATNVKLGLGTVILAELLYGSLALSFGLKDTISLLRSLKSKSYLALCIVPLAFILLFMPRGINDDKTSEIKEGIAICNSQCPVNYGYYQIDSFDYDEDNNLMVINTIAGDELIYEGIDYESVQENMAGAVAIMLSSDNNDFTKLLTNYKCGVKIICKWGKTGNSTEVTISADEVKRLRENPLSQKEVSIRMVKQYILSNKGVCPVKIDEGITCTDVFDDGENIVFLYEIDDEMYDIDSYFDFINENINEFKDEMLSNPTLKPMSIHLKQLNKGITYRFVGSSYEKALDINIASDEL